MIPGTIRATQTGRRKSIYEELHPETVHGANASVAASARWDDASRKVCDTHKPERFTSNASAATGRAERTIQIDVERAPASLRAEIEASVEHLLAMLDALDGDCDLEADGDEEPSLGWTATMAIGDRHDVETA